MKNWLKSIIHPQTAEDRMEQAAAIITIIIVALLAAAGYGLYALLT